MSTISVIVPTFNRRHLVQRAAASVRAQGPVRAELIVVDDGSTDGTGDHLTASDLALRYLVQERTGRSAARNRGMRASTGDYIVFLDSDDALLPGALATLSAVLDARADIDIVHGEGYYCDRNGLRIERISQGFPSRDRPLLDRLVLHNVIGPLHLAMIRRGAVERLQPAPFDETLHGGEDTDFWVRLAAQGSAFHHIDDLVGTYTIHDSNESSPHSAGRAAREQSLARAKRKIHDASFFPALSSATRREFLRQMLVATEEGQIDRQEALLTGTPFHTLSPRDRSSLLRFVAASNAVNDGRLDVSRARLKRAVATDPTDLRSLAMFLLAWSAPRSLRRVLERRLNRARAAASADRSLAPNWRSPAAR